jgi:hypothetical protein
MDDRNAQRFGDGLPECTKDAQADQCIRITACCVSVLYHSHNDRGNHCPDGTNRFDRISAACLHEPAPGVARHNPPDIPAQRIKAHTVFLNETSKVLGSSQAYMIPCLLQPSAQDDTWLDIAL